ncbi:xyloglucan endotransglucosylase/hydrolase 14, partial [Genlisea aurea]
ISLWFFLCSVVIVTVGGFNVTTLKFNEAYSPLFSKFNIHPSADDRAVRLLLNRLSGSGIVSSDYYSHGFFSAAIKMPSEHTAGVVVAFYTSNVDTFERNHDELDIEFLGNVKGKPWRFQTNAYGNGSVSRGREERYRLWFDPTADSHRYSILWTPITVVFYVDEIPIREIRRCVAMRGDFPAKPMSVYATIWDASSWATNGGREKVNYRYEPFVAEFTDLVLRGCIVDPSDQIPSSNCTDSTSSLMAEDFAAVSPQGRRWMKRFREKYMYYSYCYDVVRYPVRPPECVISESEREMFKNTGRLRDKMKFGGPHHRRSRNSRRRRRR